MSDDIVTRLRNWFALPKEQWVSQETAADEIERLRKDRDEARREVCHLRPSVCIGAQSADAYAAGRGWDCFKEATDAE
jgi:hypothetical protein